jgi:hypothetical protein
MTLRRGRPYWAGKPAVGGVAFISEWNTTLTSAGSSASNQIALPLVSSGVYDFTVDWGDASSDYITVWSDPAKTHTYASTGVKTITITGSLEQWIFNATGDRLKILDISSFGGVLIINGSGGAFYNCANLDISALDPLTILGGSNMFRGCTSLTGNSGFKDWITSGNFLQGIFQSCTNFNTDLTNWDTSGCTVMTSAFQSAGNFNGDITTWDVSNVGSFGAFLQNAVSFNQNIGGWNMIGCTTLVNGMRSTFAFDQNIGGWDVRNCNDFRFLMTGNTALLGLSPANLDAIYNGWSSLPSLSLSESIDFGTQKYTAAGTAGKALLTNAASTITATNAVDNGAGLIRITTGTVHGRTTGDKILISGILGTTEANGAWIVTVINTTTIDLQSSTFTNAYTSGGTVRTGYGWTITDGGI